METLPISVIIVAKNAEGTIEACLKSVGDNNPAEIIVVDGNSSDRTVEIAQKYTERIYSDEGKGLAYARQLGAEQATQEYISYIDADIVLPAGTLATMLNEFQASGYAAISAQQIVGNPSTYWERAMQEHTQIIFSRGNILGLAASLIKRYTILKYPFDLRFPLLDDGELRRRLSKDGHKLGVSSAFAYHYHKADLKGFAKQRLVNGRSWAQFAQKHGLLGLLDPTGWAPLAMVYMLLFSLVKGKTNLIPYFLLSGIIETVGMAKGSFELVGKALRKTNS
jgi:glycosyltransferase involved in cell wall biosynthesis